MATSAPTAPVDFEALVEQGREPVTRYLLARTGSTAEARELAQETFVRAYCALSRGDRPRHPLAWLLAIARNVFLESARSARYQRQLAERMSRLMGVEWQSPWQAQVEQRIVVGNAVDHLPEDLREPVLLHYFAGLSLPEVARHLEITASAAKSRLWRARQALRGELEVLVGGTERVTFTLPADLAERAKAIAERPPHYETMRGDLQVGGRHWFIVPAFRPVFSDEVMPLDDLRFAVRQLHALRAAGDRPLANRVELEAAPEVFYHPEPIAVWQFLRSAELGNEAFRESEEGRLEVTDGWVLGTDPNAPKLLADFREAGLRHVWFQFVGLRETHDDLCQRPGAFDAIAAAMKRCREAGIETGGNILVSKRNVGEVRELSRFIRSLGAERFQPTFVLIYSPTWPEYGEIRPEPEDLAEVRPDGLDANWGGGGFWERFHADPEAFTEAALTRAAIDDPQAQQPWELHMKMHGLWVTPDLDLLRSGMEDEPFERLGNLRRDTPEQLYQKVTALRLPAVLPSDAELARHYGDLSSRKVYGARRPLRRKWLEAWKVEHNVVWLPYEAYQAEEQG
jgi:RNA polymerase sigma-70 factor (ECF subfamily)